MEDLTNIKLRRCNIELWTSIKSLPVVNYQEYNAGILVDSNIGSNMDAVMRHLETLKINLRDHPKQADDTIEKLMQTYYLIINRSSPKMNSFVARIKTINGIPITDLSPANTARITKQLSAAGFTIGLLDKGMEFLKKKLLKRWTRTSRD